MEPGVPSGWRISCLQDEDGVSDPSLDVEGLRTHLMPLDLHGPECVLHEIPQSEVPVDIGPDRTETMPDIVETFTHAWPIACDGARHTPRKPTKEKPAARGGASNCRIPIEPGLG